MVRFYFRFTGRVQGVQGTRVEIEKFLNLIQTGNRFVRVDEIEKEERPYEENEKRFHVRY